MLVNFKFKLAKAIDLRYQILYLNL